MIKNGIQESLQQVEKAIQLLSAEQYAQPVKLLSDSSIGKHVRHIIEFLECLKEGYDKGEVNYDNRKRDYKIETDKAFALECLNNITNNLPFENKELILYVSCSPESDVPEQLSTNYDRELYYILEHIIHHMAILRIGITEIVKVELPKEFGLAPATIKYNDTCAQSASSH